MQGVFFRESTRRQAEQLGVTGHAINLPDGTVKVVASGSRASVAALRDWLHEGPMLARVESVDSKLTELQRFGGFTTG